MAPSIPPVAPNRGDAPRKESTLYKAVMTPVIFVSFLVSLALVDFRYSVKRSHNHAETPSRLPDWLHHILYRPRPYQYAKVTKTGTVSPGTGAKEEEERFYYHSKQRKLMKLEMDDAFEIRGTVVVLLGLLTAFAAWGVWLGVLWAYRFFTTSAIY